MVDRHKTGRRTPSALALEQDDDQPRSAVLPSPQRVPLWALPTSGDGADAGDEDEDEEE